MTITRSWALANLKPDAEFVMVDETTIDWHSKDITQPTEDEITAEVARLQAIEDYQKPRRDNFPFIGDQLDMLWHAIDADADLKTKFATFYNAIKDIKDKYPKSS
tara:strand:+ start:513 stop:827 length:315 start_codon:yes stop_codon:yes gene_type:complete